jgi:serine/threonine-protein kinase RsbW
MNRIHLQIPAHADYIDIVRLCLYGIASKMGFSFEDIEDMKVAISEVCNNAVLHVLPHDRLNVIDICFEIEETALSIKIKDYGQGLNYADTLVEASSLHETDVSNLRSGGLGIYLMQALMDELEVKTDSGTEVIMTKYISTKSSIVEME